MGGVWSSGPNLSVATHAAGGDGVSESCYIVAGSISSGATNDAYKCDGSAWSSIGDVTYAVTYPGGAGNAGAGMCIAGYAVTASYKHNGSAWSGAGNTPAIRSAGGSGGDTSTSWLAGGEQNSTPKADVYIYDGATTWSTGSSLPAAARHIGGAGYLENAFVAGDSTTTVYICNGSTWYTGPSLASARSICRCAGNASAGLCLAGWVNSVATVTTERLRGSSWSAGPNLSVARTAHVGGGSSTDAFVAGGWTGSARLTSVEFYFDSGRKCGALWW